MSLENTPLSRIQGANKFKFRILVCKQQKLTQYYWKGVSRSSGKLSGRVQNPAWKQQESQNSRGPESNSWNEWRTVICHSFVLCSQKQFEFRSEYLIDMDKIISIHSPTSLYLVRKGNSLKITQGFATKRRWNIPVDSYRALIFYQVKAEGK